MFTFFMLIPWLHHCYIMKVWFKHVTVKHQQNEIQIAMYRVIWVVYNYVIGNAVSINQSIKSSFVKGAGAHPQNAPCRRRSHALKKAPVRRGRLLSTVFHR